ncbi:mitotic spindle assembly checkpoint protein MAD1-like [Alosa alosa]|uniref:mitotic spindle assembly checkpoint protein MAD1-like n=1 Tax=Alosa alosa TaxID=278164 RepID=UPI0020154336|nr:mitotic spindle assembly checkpoint protein MAD1-like [Alosa alosa]
MQQGSTSRWQHLSPSNHTDSGRLRGVITKKREVSQDMDLNHKQACLNLKRATQCITRALQHEVDRNQELSMLIYRLENKEAETVRSLTIQVEANKQLKLKIDELQKHLEEKRDSLKQANQTVVSLKKELRVLHQRLQSQPSIRTVQEVNEWPQDGESQIKILPVSSDDEILLISSEGQGGESQIKQIKSPSSPLQSDQQTAADEPLEWSEQMMSPSGQIPQVSSDGEILLVSSHSHTPLEASVSGIKEKHAERADCRVEYTVPSDADIKFEQIQTPVSSDGQRLLEAPVSEDEDGDDDEYGEYSNSERADPRTEYTVPSAADIQFKQIQMPLSSKEKSARFHAKIRADPAARAEWLAKRRERYQQRKQAGQSSHQRVNYYQTIKELTASEAANRREQWRLYQRRCRERQRQVEAVMNLPPL